MKILKNKKYTVPLAIVTIAILLSCIIAYAVLQSFWLTAKYISALEGRKKADEIAKKWNESAVLVYIGAAEPSKVTNEGKCSMWTYLYCSNLSSAVERILSVKIDAFGNIEKRARVEEDPYFFGPIGDSIIDSTEAYRIAKRNDAISKFPDADILSFFLTVDPQYSSQHPIWYLEFRWWSELPLDELSLTYIEIVIDAHTGEVLKVEITPHDLPPSPVYKWHTPTLQNPCFVRIIICTVVFVAVILAIVVFLLKKRLSAKQGRKRYEELKEKWEKGG